MNGDTASMTPTERLESLERWARDFEERWKAAFPGGDHVGHCAYHQLMIEEVRDRKALIKALKEKTIGGLVWAAMLFVGLAAWSYVLSIIKRALG